MTNTKHTPGPWMARQMFSGSWDIAEEGGAGTLARTKEEANARLIAAAPDLLGACEAVMDDIDMGDSGLMNSTRAIVRSAIVKARGTE